MQEDQNNDDGGRVQLNISPTKETVALLERIVHRYGGRHMNAKNRNTAAADVLNKFVRVWAELIKQQDEALEKKTQELRNHLSLPEPKR